MTESTVLACVGLGANLGEPIATVRAAAEQLSRLPRVSACRLSPLYETPAWGVEAQPDFVNACALLETSLAPMELLDALLTIERAFGRDRSRELRWGPRVLDLDVLLYGDQTIVLPGLQVPHPRLHERAFALVPLLDVWPEARIPGQGFARDAVSALDRSNIRSL